jgi:hypothetical protein
MKNELKCEQKPFRVRYAEWCTPFGFWLIQVCGYVFVIAFIYGFLKGIY